VLVQPGTCVCRGCERQHDEFTTAEREEEEEEMMAAEEEEQVRSRRHALNSSQLKVGASTGFAVDAEKKNDRTNNAMRILEKVLPETHLRPREFPLRLAALPTALLAIPNICARMMQVGCTRRG